MLTFYHRLAVRLQSWRAALWLACTLAVAGVFVPMFLVAGEAGGRYVFTAITVLIWLIALLTVSHGFAVPPPVSVPGLSFRERWGVRIRRAALWVMALLMTTLSLLVAFVTVRALGVWLRSF